MNGESGSYAINGQVFIFPPSVGRWIPPDPVGVDGNGHPIYPTKTEFELRWSNLTPSGTYQLYEFFRSLHITGSAVVDLPRYGWNSYAFYSYSGCSVFMPEYGRYFFGDTLDITLVIGNIKYDTF